jgi:hypothetical protein
MRSARNFSSEWGYLAPAPSFARTARVVLVATAIGATAGAGVGLSLVDRSPEPERTSVAARAIMTSVHEAAAPATPQMSAAPAAAPVAAPASPTISPPASSPVARSEVATQLPNHALVPPSPSANQLPAASSTEANASVEGPTPVTPSENTAAANARETSAAQTTPAGISPTQANSEPSNAALHSASGVTASSEPSATGPAADATNGGASAQETVAQKKAKHHLARAPFRGIGTLFHRFFVAHAARTNY